MQKWKPYKPFNYPDDPKDEPLLLAALKKEPREPWVTYLNLKFAFDKVEARRLSPIERSTQFRRTLDYLEPAREILQNANKTRPDDKKLRADENGSRRDLPFLKEPNTRNKL